MIQSLQLGTYNTLRRHSKYQVLVNRGTLHCRAVQDFFFIRPLLSRAGDVADFPNIEKHTQRVRHKETDK